MYAVSFSQKGQNDMNGLNNIYVESIIKKASDGKIATAQAASKLGVSKQYVNRLKRRYKAEGIKAFDHGNKGKSRAWATDPAVKERVIELYKGKYAGLNFRHFREKLEEVEGIDLSYKTLHLILTAAGLKSPKRHRKRKAGNKHPSRPRRQCFGELLQIDASIHRWFGEECERAALHGAIDDATGMVMGLYFDKEETLRGYYEMMWQILTKYGIPEALYGDNRSVFEFRKLSEKGQTIDRDSHIQFKRMCMMLGIELITTSVSQAKGRIERLWQTLQSRLMAELALRNIKTIEEANAYLPEFMEDFNKRFAIKPDMETSLFAPAPSPKEIDFYLSIQHERKLDNGSSFGFQGKRWQLADDDGNTVRATPKSKIDIYVTRDGRTVAVYDGKIYDLKSPESTAAEAAEKKKVGRPKWKPGPNHPWKNFIINPDKRR